MKKVTERDNIDLLELALQLHSRAINNPSSKKMHDAAIEAKQELERRLCAGENDVLHGVMHRDEFARYNWNLILKHKVALTQQRVVDSNQYGASCYEPITIDCAINDLYAAYMKIHGA